MENSPLPIVDHKPISSGMSAGWHKKIAITGIFGTIVLAIICNSSTMITFGIFLIFSSVGLIGEAAILHHKGEVIVRKSRGSDFVSIIRKDHPKRFYFHIATFAVIGIFSLVIGTFLLWATL